VQETAWISISKSLAAFALVEMETDPELSLLLATESVKTTYDTGETVLPLSNTVLRQMIIKSRVRLTLTGHDGQVVSAAYSSDGQRIVTAGGDGTAKAWDKLAKVWDAKTGQELLTLKGHEVRVHSAAYSPDGKRIATAAEGVVLIYTTDINELLQIAESRVIRQLTAEEKERYGVLDLN
jgi:WD40 repeat protein